MLYIIDLILALIMASIIIKGWRKGFIASLLSIASVIISGIMVLIFRSPVAQWISDSFVASPVIRTIRNNIASLAEGGNLDSLIYDMPEKLKSYLVSFNIDPADIQSQYAEFEASASNFIDKLAQDIGTPISMAISTAIAIVVIFVVSMIVCKIISFIVNMCIKKSPFDKANKILGLCIGILNSLLFAFVVSAIVSFFAHGFAGISAGTGEENALSGSILIRFFSSFNPLNLFLK